MWGNAMDSPYFFSSNNMKNTTLFAANAPSDPLYTVTTNLVADTHTHIDDARSRRRIATITRRDIFSDTVTFSDITHPNHGKPISLHKWLQKRKLIDGYPAHAMQISAGTWTWKSDLEHRLGLYRGCDDHNQPQCIAYLQPASPAHPLSLFLDPAAEPFRDEILVACLVLEQRLRIAERNIHVGAGKFEQNKTVLGHYVHT